MNCKILQDEHVLPKPLSFQSTTTRLCVQPAHTVCLFPHPKCQL